MFNALTGQVEFKGVLVALSGDQIAEKTGYIGLTRSFNSFSVILTANCKAQSISPALPWLTPNERISSMTDGENSPQTQIDDWPEVRMVKSVTGGVRESMSSCDIVEPRTTFYF